MRRFDVGKRRRALSTARCEAKDNVPHGFDRCLGGPSARGRMRQRLEGGRGMRKGSAVGHVCARALRAVRSRLSAQQASGGQQAVRAGWQPAGVRGEDRGRIGRNARSVLESDRLAPRPVTSPVPCACRPWPRAPRLAHSLPQAPHRPAPSGTSVVYGISGSSLARGCFAPGRRRSLTSRDHPPRGTGRDPRNDSCVQPDLHVATDASALPPVQCPAAIATRPSEVHSSFRAQAGQYKQLQHSICYGVIHDYQNLHRQTFQIIATLLKTQNQLPSVPEHPIKGSDETWV